VKLYELTIHKALDLLQKREISATELTQASLDRIVQVDNHIKAYLTLTPEAALAEASSCRWRRRSPPGYSVGSQG